MFLNFEFSKSFQSEILIDSEQKQLLFKLCGIKPVEIWRLVYRGSRDGFNGLDFHKNCDNRSKTLTIIRTTNGCIFGGYTEKEWNQIGEKGHYKTDDNAFIFSLVNERNTPCRVDVEKGQNEKEKSIACYASAGPTFGGGHDIYVANESNVNVNSHCKFGYSFRLSGYEYGSNQAKCFLAGSEFFQTDEIEVFQKQ